MKLIIFFIRIFLNVFLLDLLGFIRVLFIRFYISLLKNKKRVNLMIFSNVIVAKPMKHRISRKRSLLFACIGVSRLNIYCSYDVIFGFLQSDKVFDILKGSHTVKIIIAENIFFLSFQTFPAQLKTSYF